MVCYRAYNIEKFLMWKPVALSRFAQAQFGAFYSKAGFYIKLWDVINKPQWKKIYEEVDGNQLILQVTYTNNPIGNYMFKVNNRNTRTRCEICSKLTIKKPEFELTLNIFEITWNIFHTLLYCSYC